MYNTLINVVQLSAPLLSGHGFKIFYYSFYLIQGGAGRQNCSLSHLST